MHLSQCECTPYYTVNTWVADFMCTVECDKRVCVSQWVYIFCVLIDCCILTPRTSSVGSKSSPSDTESVQTNEHMHGTSTHTYRYANALEQWPCLLVNRQSWKNMPCSLAQQKSKRSVYWASIFIFATHTYSVHTATYQWPPSPLRWHADLTHQCLQVCRKTLKELLQFWT